jgi:hypothetical protein
MANEEILTRYLSAEDAAGFRFSFSGAIAPIHPGTEPATALPNAYSVLGRAKTSPQSRLLVVFDQSFESPGQHGLELEQRIARIRSRLALGEAVAHDERGELEESERVLTFNIAVLKKAEQVFRPTSGARQTAGPQ